LRLAEGGIPDLEVTGVPWDNNKFKVGVNLDYLYSRYPVWYFPTIAIKSYSMAEGKRERSER